MTTARLAVDIGGTFTDVVLDTGERRLTTKLLTTSAAPERAVLAGIDAVLADAGLAAAGVATLIHGTTLATNAIIERKGALTALIATDGFRDVLDIAYESRYDQYDVFIDKPVPLVPRHLRMTVAERVDVTGSVLKPLDEAAVEALIPRLVELQVQSVAVALIHSYANSRHEERIRDILAKSLPRLSVSISAEVCPEVREYERTSTTAANAYVRPMMAGYLTRLGRELTARGLVAPVYLMTSGGGLTTLETAVRFPIRLVESGPAGGAILACHVAAECGDDKVVSFDMGGTTAKICLIENGKPFTSRSFEVDRAARFLKGSGLPLRIPVIEMVEIGAGGGSIARVDAMGRIVVGPDSAGSEPGPACYARGGVHPTVTDADLELGRIDAADFAGGKLPLAQNRAAEALERDVGARLKLTTELAAYGVGEIVDENMANAARVHAVERGKVISDHTLIAFGGAAPLHATRLAEKLGIARVVVPTNAGVGSAVGFLKAPIAYEVVRSRYMRVAQFDPAIANKLLRAMQQEALAVVRAGSGDLKLTETRQAYMRYVGQGHEIVVPLPARDLREADRLLLQESFDREYSSLFARTIPNAETEVLSWAVTVATEATVPRRVAKPNKAEAPKPSGERAVFDADQGRMIRIPVYRRDRLRPGMRLDGPAIIAEDETTTVVSAKFEATIDRSLYIILERRQRAS
ncbi:MAG: hydantoinase/oxoprolinase family protein [Proteobacteria bacterium]|nr:hydantoinase/oxoprolinase family protein [Pseudomonadota bacterium]MBI3499849.1 hydantoinase/oxoprolinase family protein [Pseudomonadota bacterium]